MKRTNRWLMSCLAALSLMACRSQGAQEVSLAATLEQVRAEYSLPSLAGVVIRGGEVADIAAVGVRRLGAPEAVSVNDPYDLGSVSKSFTATVIARLVELGDLRWGTPLSEVFPDLPMQEAYRDVTVEMLLAMRGGFPGEGESAVERVDWSTREGSYEALRAASLRLALDDAPAYTPGSRAVYSNSGYLVVVAVAEEVTGRRLVELTRDYVFEPLGMNTAGFGVVVPGEVAQPWPHEYGPEEDRFEPLPPGPASDLPAVYDGVGNIDSSAPDLARYLIAHLTGEAEGNAVLTAASYRRLHTSPYSDEWTLGWAAIDLNGVKGLAFTGSNVLNYAVVGFVPEAGVGVVLLTNAWNEGLEEGLQAVAVELLVSASEGP